MHLHILGICGTFMGGIAAIARQAGHTVTGCDANVYPPMSTQLQSLGIALTEGYAAAQLDGVAKTADVFVIGNAISRGNPLLEAILDSGRPYTSGPQWLAETVLPGKWVLAVAGTHGKTTATALLAWILEHAGLQPGFLIGGVAVDFDVSARLTDSAFFVIEADEYDTAFCDKRSKFVHYRPRTAILNNLEHDHADIFPDLAAIETQFHHLVRTVPRQGRLIVNGGEDSLRRVLARGCWSEVERFGFAAGCGYRLRLDDRGGRHDQAWRRAAGRARTLRADRAPQPAQCAGGDRRRPACRRSGAARAYRARGVSRHQAPARVAWHGRRRQRLRRLRASSDRDRDHARRPAAGGWHVPHPGRARTAIEHDEAGHDEGAAAGQPCRGRSRLSVIPPTSAGTWRGRWRRWDRARKCTPTSPH